MRKKTIKAIGVLVVVIIIFTSMFLITRYIDLRNNSKEYEAYIDESSYIDIDGDNYLMKDNIEVILCVGLDSYENEKTDNYRNDEFADFICLLIMDNKNKYTIPIQINRDTMAKVNILGVGGKIAGKTNEQLAFSHTYGDGDMKSLVNVKNAVRDLFNGIRIDYYLSMNMSAIQTINDDVGGVSVYVEDDFSNIDSSIRQGEYITLNGKQALTFVRARQGMEDSSNVSRMERQKTYLRALYEQSKQYQNDEQFMYDTLENIDSELVANVDLYGLSDLGNKIIEYDLLDAISIEGEVIKGETFNEFYPDRVNINDICKAYLLKYVEE